MPEKPLYINIIRKPLDRLVSYYYFLRYGDDYRPHLVRHRAGDTMSFDDCVKLKKPDCDPKNMWLQIPFFCGHHHECFEAGSEWALEQAKRNLVNEYFLVGMTEELGDFIEMLELSLPRMFQGIVSNTSHLINPLSNVELTPQGLYHISTGRINRTYERQKASPIRCPSPKRRSKSRRSGRWKMNFTSLLTIIFTSSRTSTWAAANGRTSCTRK